MRNVFACILFLFGVICFSSAIAGDDDNDKCTKAKTLTITLPEDVTKEPIADPEKLCVTKNSNLDVVLVASDPDAEVKINFLHGKTPIGNGNNKEEIKKTSKKLKVRNDCGGCEFEYKVYDATPGSTRPPLDPVIIIER